VTIELISQIRVPEKLIVAQADNTLSAYYGALSSMYTRASKRISEAMTIRHTSTVAWDVTQYTLNDAAYLPISLFFIIFGTQHGTSTFLYNVDKLLPDFKVSHLRKWYY
jgi:hypothetical protein